jgi:hypothetical protein
MKKTVAIMTSVFVSNRDSREPRTVPQSKITMQQRIVTKDDGLVNSSYLLMHAMDLVPF